MKFILEIDCDNAAFEEGYKRFFEISRILTELADKLHDYGYAHIQTLRDVNGNTVGKAEFIDG